MRDDISISFTLDRLDFEPTLVRGFTATELMIASGVFFVFWAVFWLVVFALFGKAMVGIGVAFAFTLISVFVAAGRVEILKRGRPSYLLWVDLKRRLQTRGVLGVKVNFKLIDSSNWDVITHAEAKK